MLSFSIPNVKIMSTMECHYAQIYSQVYYAECQFAETCYAEWQS